jgi:hypothetical protein
MNICQWVVHENDTDYAALTLPLLKMNSERFWL